MFGLPMEVPTYTGRRIQLRSIAKTEAATMSAGFSSYRINRTLSLSSSPTPEQEEAWIDGVAIDKARSEWDIYCDGQLIGNTTLGGIIERRAPSGCCIFRQDMLKNWSFYLIPSIGVLSEKCLI